MTAETQDTPKSQAELRAEKLIKRHDRNMRKAKAEGFLAGICSQLKPGDLAMDLGANMGEITTILADTGADVIAFEPDPYAFEKLKKRFKDKQNVTLINAAVGASEGTVKLMRAENFNENPKGASVKSTILDGGRSIDAGNYVEVPLIDFLNIVDTEVKKRGEIAFVKMDIEGAELDILEAMHAQDKFGPIRCLVAETHERKFRDLRPRFKALRQAVSESYPPNKVNLEWI
ncbi:MAG: FkbM family methyltransferase [Pseudomonadota bacterium]